MKRRRSRKDDNHKACAEAFTQLGCTVVDTEDLGDGFPDLVVGCIGLNFLVEVKNLETDYGRKGFNKNQKNFNATWRGDRVWLVTSPLECHALVINWRKNYQTQRNVALLNAQGNTA